MSKGPTLAKVAQRAGVSVSTASLAFSGAGPVAPATRERVLAAAAALGYHGPHPVARSLRRGAAGVIGVVLGGRLRNTFRDPISAKTLDGMAGELGERGLGMLMIPVDPVAGVELPPSLHTAAMDAAILWGPPSDDPPTAALLARGVPLVALDGSIGLDIPVVGIDDAAGMQMLYRHLTELGHSDIAVVSLPLHHVRRHRALALSAWREATYYSTYARLKALDELGATPIQVLETTGSGVEEGKRAGLQILSGTHRPTAIIALSDFLASGVVFAARELGLRIPGDVAIVGFDGLDFPWLAPDQLTTIDQPLEDKGRLVAEAAARVAAGERPPDVTLPVRFRKGTTT